MRLSSESRETPRHVRWSVLRRGRLFFRVFGSDQNSTYFFSRRKMLSIDLGTINLGYAVLSGEELDFGLLTLGRTNNSVERVNNLYSSIEPIVKKYGIAHLVVEQQVRQNPAAMQLMYSLLGMVKGMGINQITVFPAREKFIKLKIPYTTDHKEHKKLSILIAETLIEKKYPHLIQKFREFKKKDDISDALLMLYLSHASPEELTKLSDEFKESGKKVQTREYTERSGEFFPYINRSGIDLSVLQIGDETIFADEPSEGAIFADRDIFGDSCFLHACRVSGEFTEEELEKIKNLAPERKLPVRRIKDIAKEIGVHFLVKFFDHTKLSPSGKIRQSVALDTRKLRNISGTRLVRMILFMNHYMFDTKVLGTKVVPLLSELIEKGLLVPRGEK